MNETRPIKTSLEHGDVREVAQELGRRWIGIELNPEYAKMVERRAAQYGWAM